MAEPLYLVRNPFGEPPACSYPVEIVVRFRRSPPEPPVWQLGASAATAGECPAGTLPRFPYISPFFSLGGSGGSGSSAPIEYGCSHGTPCWVSGVPKGFRCRGVMKLVPTCSPRNARALNSAADKKATTCPGRIARTPRQITVDYLASATDRQARLSFLHPQHSPRKGKVRNDAEMTTRSTRSRHEATTPETARNARGTQASRLPAPRLSETRTANRASRREERTTIARAATILTTRKEPTYD